MRKDYRATVRFDESTSAQLSEIMKNNKYKTRSRALRELITYYYKKKIIPEKISGEKDHGLEHNVTISLNEESILESAVKEGLALNKDDAIRMMIREYQRMKAEAEKRKH